MKRLICWIVGHSVTHAYRRDAVVTAHICNRCHTAIRFTINGRAA